MNMTKQSKRNSCAGLTMVELIIGIVIMGIISSVAIPNFLKYPPKGRLNGATRVLASDLMAARMDAVKLNRTVYLEYSNNKSYRVAYLGKVLKTKTFSDEYQDVKISSDFGKIFFNSRGASTGINTIKLENISGSKNIKINIAGRVNIE